jgi:hypothetical protein
MHTQPANVTSEMTIEGDRKGSMTVAYRCGALSALAGAGAVACAFMSDGWLSTAGIACIALQLFCYALGASGAIVAIFGLFQHRRDRASRALFLCIGAIVGTLVAVAVVQGGAGGAPGGF